MQQQQWLQHDKSPPHTVMKTTTLSLIHTASNQKVYEDSLLEVDAKARHHSGQAESNRLTERNMKLMVSKYVMVRVT